MNPSVLSKWGMGAFPPTLSVHTQHSRQPELWLGLWNRSPGKPPTPAQDPGVWGWACGAAKRQPVIHRSKCPENKYHTALALPIAASNIISAGRGLIIQCLW